MPETDSRSIWPGSCRLCRELQLPHLHPVARLEPGLIRKILAPVLLHTERRASRAAMRPDEESLCAAARKSPLQGGEWRFGEPPPDAQAAPHEEHESLQPERPLPMRH